jgi:DNA-binding CsgD family transcriptional regulator
MIVARRQAEQSASHQGVMAGIRRLWESRDELSLLNLRWSLLPSTLIFPLAVMLSDTLYRDWGTGILGLDSALFQSLLYGSAWLVAVLLPKVIVRFLPIVGALGCVLLLVPALLSAEAGTTGLILVSVFQFSAGLVAAGGFFHFCYRNDNAERWLALIAIGLYYVLTMLVGALPGAGLLFTRLVAIVLTLALVVCVYISVRSSKGDGVGQEESEGAVASASSKSLSFGRVSVLLLVALYYLISLADSWLESTVGFLQSAPYGFGMLLALVCATLVQLVLNKSVWHLWNLYLFLAVVGLLIALLSAQGSLPVVLGSLFNGMADNLGYLAVLYLLGGAASRDGSYSYFRVMCLFAFLFSAAIPLLLEQILRLMGTAAPLFALALIFACIGGYIVLSPLLQRHVFAADWMDSTGVLDIQTHGPQAAKVAAIDLMQDLGLTPRERDVLTLLLTDAAPKQIAHELKISTSTFNYHSANLYRKLGVNSRIELFTRFSTTNPN